MSVEVIEAKVTKGDRAGEVFKANFDLPQNVNEALEKYGEEIVYSRFKSSLVIDVQACMRNAITKDGATPETVQAAVDEFKPGIKQKGKSMAEKVHDMLANMSEEERREFLADYL